MAEASSASATKSDEEKVEMMDRLLTRLALCDDSNLQPLLSKLLPFTISSRSSQSSAVRNKVLEILSFSSKYTATEKEKEGITGFKKTKGSVDKRLAKGAACAAAFQACVGIPWVHMMKDIKGPAHYKGWMLENSSMQSRIVSLELSKLEVCRKN
ncbi:hypothetical protein ACFX2I_015221 [Malus domestica]